MPVCFPVLGPCLSYVLPVLYACVVSCEHPVLRFYVLPVLCACIVSCVLPVLPIYVASCVHDL